MVYLVNGRDARSPSRLANNPIDAGTGLWYYIRVIQKKGIRSAYGMVVNQNHTRNVQDGVT